MISLFWYLNEMGLLGFDLEQTEKNSKLSLTTRGFQKLISELQSYRKFPNNENKVHV